MKTQGNTVGVIGLGLIGCSLAIGLKKSGFAARVLGSDKCPEHEREALQAGHIDEIATSEQIARLSDTVIVAVPVDVAAEVVCGVLDASGDDTTVIDVGSTKQRIVRAVASHPAHARFVPTHPMAGTENSGPLAAVDGLSRVGRSSCCRIPTRIPNGCRRSNGCTSVWAPARCTWTPNGTT